MIYTCDKCISKLQISNIRALILCSYIYELPYDILELIYNYMIFLSVENKTFLTGFPDNLTIKNLHFILCNGKHYNNWKLCLLYSECNHFSDFCNFIGKEPKLNVFHYGAYRPVLKDDIKDYKINIEIVDISTINFHISYILKNDVNWKGQYILYSGTNISNTLTIKQKCSKCLFK